MQIDRPVRILIIDDDLIDREVYRQCLSQSKPWVFECNEASTAREGIDTARSWSPDCILLGFNLPDMNGVEVLSRLKDGGDAMPCAVVMLTAFGSESLAVKAIQAGALDYVPKGRVAPDTLSHAIMN